MDAKKMSVFQKVLVANRGEIACRIIRTCRRLGIRTVAVFSDADANSLHVRSAAEAVHLGPAPARDSYLNIERMIAVARQTGAQAIHPGYGFLAENADFADACTNAGIVFIGPPASAIRIMGSKSAAKALMLQSGVPLTPGYHGENQDPDFLLTQANAIGYPILIKASAGGGGKGMRRVDRTNDFPASLAACRREAKASFADDRVLLERYLEQPRHIEIQIFADTHGNLVSLFERDCSVQRRYQKVIEEAPAPNLSEPQRRAMSEAAKAAARAVGYLNAGTVEFITDQHGHFYFMEMNTRLQVEHPVTEMITGLDLVEWQLKVAAREPLPLKQDQITSHGHAIETRIYAEDPANQFLPSTGTLVHLHWPEPSLHVRVDAGVDQGDAITSFYDPMIAKLIVWDETRTLAIHRLNRALSDIQIVGVSTNLEFLSRLIAIPAFEQGRIDTGLIEREGDRLLSPPGPPPAKAILLAALSLVLNERRSTDRDDSPWAASDGLRLNSFLTRTLRFRDAPAVSVDYIGLGLRMRLEGHNHDVNGSIQSDGSLIATINGLRHHVTVIAHAGNLHVFYEGRHYRLTPVDPLASKTHRPDAQSTLLSPIPARITAVLAEPGARVEKGTPILVLEAMKMEYTIKAPAIGKIESFHFNLGDQVPEGIELLSFIPE